MAAAIRSRQAGVKAGVRQGYSFCVWRRKARHFNFSRGNSHESQTIISAGRRIWTEFKKTIIFVTHSIEESIYLADRIVVMTYRPGKIKKDVRVTMPRSRDPSSADFNDLKKELSLLVMAGQVRHNLAEIKAPTADCGCRWLPAAP